MRYLVRRETIELLTSPRENCPPLVIAFCTMSRRVVLLASDATTVSRSKLYNVETCSGAGDDVYFLSGLFPAFRDFTVNAPSGWCVYRGLQNVCISVANINPFPTFFFCAKNFEFGNEIRWNKGNGSIGIVYVGVVRLWLPPRSSVNLSRRAGTLNFVLRYG